MAWENEVDVLQNTDRRYNIVHVCASVESDTVNNTLSTEGNDFAYTYITKCIWTAWMVVT